jgi:hypothetical protein
VKFKSYLKNNPRACQTQLTTPLGRYPPMVFLKKLKKDKIKKDFLTG